MQPSQKELVLRAIREMNLPLLEVLEEELQMRQGVERDLRATELSAAFGEFRKAGDHHLNMSAGKCCFESCEHCDKSGYLFWGEHSKKCFNIVFEEENNQFVGACSCRFFYTGDEQLRQLTNIDLSDCYRKESLCPTVEFSQLSVGCIEALSTFRAMAVNGFVDEIACLTWLDEYKDLYQSFVLPPLWDADQKKFHNNYSRINELVGYEINKADAMRALADFPKTSNQEDILNWCRQYESLGQSLLLFGWTSADYLKVDEVTLLLPGLTAVACFKELFDEHYWSLNLNNIG